jgi:ABC-type lipoprotein release transport system permease subunit
MNVIRLLKRMLGIDRRALSAPILALILLVVGVALAIVVASMAGGFLFGWGTSARVTVEHADIIVTPADGRAYITVDIRNSGGAQLTACSVQVTGEGLSSPVSLTGGATTLNPGQVTTWSASGQTGLSSGRIYIVRVTCTGPGGATVTDQKSVPAHI